MNGSRIFGLIVLAAIWLWLVWALLFRGGGFTAYNLFVIIVSGIIIFVPIWKKYFRKKKE